MQIPSFKESQEWKANGNHFCVVVRHWETGNPPMQDDGGHRWNIYAYVYPKHPHFTKFDGLDMRQPAANELPMHGGPSFLRWHYGDDLKPVSVQVGCAFTHLHDDCFPFYSDCSQACEVFAWAESLFNALSKMEQA